jgi:hypothetical protein
MDLIRELMLMISDGDIRERSINEADHYHLHLLKDAGFVDGLAVHRFPGSGKISCELLTPLLTWTGTEFLETIRQKTMWEKLKKFLGDRGVGLTLDGIKIAAPIVVSAALAGNHG